MRLLETPPISVSIKFRQRVNRTLNNKYESRTVTVARVAVKLVDESREFQMWRLGRRAAQLRKSVINNRVALLRYY